MSADTFKDVSKLLSASYELIKTSKNIIQVGGQFTEKIWWRM